VLGGIEKNTRVMASRVLFNSSTLPFQVFFKKHPEFAKNDFYITGESYAGHYIPAFASRVHQGNKANEGIHINLKVVLASLHQLFSPFPFSIPLCLFNS
jgi:carboxypeptidase C (cathepsin A)